MRNLVFVYTVVALLGVGAELAQAQQRPAAPAAPAAAPAAGVGRNEDVIGAFRQACCGDGVTGAVAANCNEDLVKNALRELTGSSGAESGRRGN